MRDGRIVWVHGEAQVVRDKAGRPLFLQGMAYEITEKKRAEQALHSINVELERRVEMRTAELEQAYTTLARQTQELIRSNGELQQFAYVASHDLQEPLRMVASFTQLLAKRYRGKLDADADEFIGYVVDGATRMQRLIDDLLTYSRIGRTGKGVTLTDCSVVFAGVRANLRKAIDECGAAVTADPLPIVRPKSRSYYSCSRTWSATRSNFVAIRSRPGPRRAPGGRRVALLGARQRHWH